MSFVIADPEDITPEWLTDVLRRNRVLAYGEVAQIFVELRVALKEHPPKLRVGVDDLLDARDVVDGGGADHDWVRLLANDSTGGVTCYWLPRNDRAVKCPTRNQ